MSVDLLKQWDADGTLRRLDDVRTARTPIRIKRTSGEFVTGVIAAWGHGGLSHIVAWGRNLEGVRWNMAADRVEFPDGVAGKMVKTEDLIEWNPWLATPQPNPRMWVSPGDQP